MRPYELLPLPAPRDFDPGKGNPSYFYTNFARHFIPDMLQMMDVGLDVNSEAVEELRGTIDNVLKTVEDRLLKNNLIQDYLFMYKMPGVQHAHVMNATKSLRNIEYYVKPFKQTDVLHRTWVVNSYLLSVDRADDRQDKWTLKDLKLYNVFLKDKFLSAIVEKKNFVDNKHVNDGMLALAAYKLELWNRPRLKKAEEIVPTVPFNPGSAKQKQEFFAMLKIKPLATSKDTGEASWGRKFLEALLQQTSDDVLKDALEAMIDHSYSAIIRNNFLKAFDSFTIDGTLHGNIRLFGAKSFRNTSNSPNLLNAPSSRSIYAKPLKRCFVASEGHIIYTADLSALEDRVIANLSGDENKCNVFLEDLDGHSLNACGYFPGKVSNQMGENRDNVAYVKEFYRRVNEGDKVLQKIRFDSKEPTFKLAYGGFPDADKGGVITQDIFDNYHNTLYPGITDYRENYVLPFTKRNGYIHLGLGCRMYSSDPGQAIRTLNNATVQFWSILTLIAINEFNYRIREARLTEQVKVISTIYDSIYVKVIADCTVIKWVNDTLIELMCVQYLEEETIHNEATGEIGLNWADLHRVPNNASVSEIDAIMKEIK